MPWNADLIINRRHVQNKKISRHMWRKNITESREQFFLNKKNDNHKTLVSLIQ